MAIYFLIIGNRITQEIDTTDTDVIVLPILDSARAVSLINKVHVVNLMTSNNWTQTQVITKLGLIDERQGG